MEPDKLNIIFYVFISIFSVTALITFLGITNVVKFSNTKYLNALFTALILEVAAAVVLSYKQIDFTCQTEDVVRRLCQQVGSVPDSATLEQKVVAIEQHLANNGGNATAIENLNDQIDALESELSNCKQNEDSNNLEISKLDKVFYSNVIKLRIVSEKFRGRTINLLWDKANKGEVYEILGHIFLDLGHVGPDDQLTDEFIINKYIGFAERSGWDYLLKKNEAGNYNQVLVDEYATTLFLREYLNQKYPLKKQEES